MANLNWWKTDELVKINHNPIWSCIPDHPYGISIIGDSGPGKTNMLLNLIKHQKLDIDKIFMFIKDPFGSKYQLLIKWREKIAIESFKNPKAFILIEKQFMMSMKI